MFRHVSSSCSGHIFLSSVVPVSAPPAVISPSSSASVRQLPQPRVDGLLGLDEDIQEVLGLVGLPGREERVGGAGGALAARATDAVDIVLGVAGVVVVDDEANVVDVL